MNVDGFNASISIIARCIGKDDSSTRITTSSSSSGRRTMLVRITYNFRENYIDHDGRYYSLLAYITKLAVAIAQMRRTFSGLMHHIAAWWQEKAKQRTALDGLWFSVQRPRAIFATIRCRRVGPDRAVVLLLTVGHLCRTPLFGTSWQPPYTVLASVPPQKVDLMISYNTAVTIPDFAKCRHPFRFYRFRDVASFVA